MVTKSTIISFPSSAVRLRIAAVPPPPERSRMETRPDHRLAGSMRDCPPSQTTRERVDGPAVHRAVFCNAILHSVDVLPGRHHESANGLSVSARWTSAATLGAVRNP